MSKTPPPVALETRRPEDGRLHSPSAGRNRGFIAAALAEHLPENAVVQEIGSGTGEHAVAACQARPDISWRPSDPNAESRASQAVWAKQAEGRIADPEFIDASDPEWAHGRAFDALVCINVIHISPFAVTEGLAAGAAQALSAGGVVYLYGPYQEGEATAPSNLEFDANLKARDPSWGVRALDEVSRVFAAQGFSLEKRIGMPANNLSLIFRRMR
jgi:hypothetical protein